MIQSVVDQEMDVIVASLTLTNQREMVLDFVAPLGKETYSFYVRTPEGDEFTWSTFLKPFSSNLWLFLVVFAMVYAIFLQIILTVYEVLIGDRIHNLLDLAERGLKLTILVKASYFGMHVPVQLTKSNKTFQGMVTFTTLLGGFVLFAAYNAS